MRCQRTVSHAAKPAAGLTFAARLERPLQSRCFERLDDRRRPLQVLHAPEKHSLSNFGSGRSKHSRGRRGAAAFASRISPRAGAELHWVTYRRAAHLARDSQSGPTHWALVNRDQPPPNEMLARARDPRESPQRRLRRVRWQSDRRGTVSILPIRLHTALGAWRHGQVRGG